MPNTRLYIFDANSLLKLLTHYSENEVPMDCELIELGVHPALQRMISLKARSKEWQETRELLGSGELWPLHFRYEGKRTMQWHDKAEPTVWTEENAIEAPRNQS